MILKRILQRDSILKTIFSVKIRDTHKIEKYNTISISFFGYENNEKYSIYVSKQCCEKTC